MWPRGAHRAADRYNGDMSGRDHDLTSDPSAERIADRVPDEAQLAAADALTGGEPGRAPRSLQSAELEPDDEDLAAGEEWDDPELL